MKRFKSFDPPKFSTQKDLADDEMFGHRLTEFCANCGFPMGAHFDVDCPQSSNPRKIHYSIPGNYQTIKPLKNGRKKSCQQ